MVDVDTFLTTLYVMVDDFGTLALLPEPHPGPQAALSRSEVVTLVLFGQWQGFGSERGVYRYAQRHLRAAFPSLPTREQYNRQVRRQHTALVAFFLPLVRRLAAQCCASEALDSSGVPTRDVKRQGAGWLTGLPISAGATGWAGMRASLCSWRSIPGEGSPAAVLGLPVRTITPWRRRALPCAAIPTRAWGAWVPRLTDHLSSTRAARGRPISSSGGGSMALRASVHRSAMAERLGPSGYDAGWRGCARAWRPCMRSSGIRSVSIGNGPMTSPGCKRAWRQRWPCITSVCG